MLIFNTQNWTGIYDGTPYADLDVDQQDVRNYLARTDNTVKIRAVGDYMAPSNAFLVLRNASSDGPPALPTLPTPAPADGSTVSLAATIKPAISIEITPSSVNFGSLGPGMISENQPINITNKGSTSIDVTLEVTDTADDLYVRGMQINEAAWSGYQAQLTPASTKGANLRLNVPVDYAGVGEKKGTAMFWAMQAP
jgi:hypothetical protein